MLFSSYSFLFCFLPLVVILWRMTAGQGPMRLALLLLAFSAAFYGLWGWAFLCLLVAMALMNYAFGSVLAAPRPDDSKLMGFLSRKGLLTLAVLLNLAPLLWFKYSTFIGSSVCALFGATWNHAAPGLPLGISFYTFIQTAWLVGVYQRKFSPQGLVLHGVLTSGFPWVISGPIVRWEQIGPQLANLRNATSAELSEGFTLFSIGLAKKIILADTLGTYADAVFRAAENAFPISGCEAWMGSMCYTFQLYFDFSGYTDMAIGLGLMMGLRLPENFNAPYKSTGIVDFWRRWHITLGSWLRDFLYIPLGGNRKGKLCQYRNLFLTMLIGGAWHGAGWTFILWGALHGAMLSVNHYFRASTKDTSLGDFFQRPWMRLSCIALTFLCISLCWVVFRAQTLTGAGRMLDAMFFPKDAAYMAGYFPNHYFTSWIPFALVAVSAFICWFLPTSRELLHGRKDGSRPWLSFTGSALWAWGLAFLTLVSLVLASRVTTFLYFQF